MTIDFEKIVSAHTTVGGIYKEVSKIFETINGVWVLRYQNETPLDEALVASLIDFEYIDNKDGTVTLTAWKGTLNGVASTELVIPDNPNILL